MPTQRKYGRSTARGTEADESDGRYREVMAPLAQLNCKPRRPISSVFGWVLKGGMYALGCRYGPRSRMVESTIAPLMRMVKMR